MYVSEKTTTDQLMTIRRNLGIAALTVEADANGRYVATARLAREAPKVRREVGAAAIFRPERPATIDPPDDVPITLTGVGPTVAQAIDAVVIEAVDWWGLDEPPLALLMLAWR